MVVLQRPCVTTQGCHVWSSWPACSRWELCRLCYVADWLGWVDQLTANMVSHDCGLRLGHFWVPPAAAAQPCLSPKCVCSKGCTADFARVTCASAHGAPDAPRGTACGTASAVRSAVESSWLTRSLQELLWFRLRGTGRPGLCALRGRGCAADPGAGGCRRAAGVGDGSSAAHTGDHVPSCGGLPGKDRCLGRAPAALRCCWHMWGSPWLALY